MSYLRHIGLVLGCVCVLLLVAVGYPATAQQGSQLGYGDVVVGRITREGFRQVFYFRARQGDVITARMTPLSGTLDPLLLLADNAGNVLARSDDAETDLGALIDTVQVPDSNFYFLIATRFGHELGMTEGEFELALQRVGVLSESGAFLSYGDSVLGFIDDQTPQLTYTFEAQRGDIVNVHMQRISGNLDSYVYIADEVGQVLAVNDDREGSLDAEIQDFLILEPGLYTVVATRFGRLAGTSRGSFVLTLETAPTSGLGLTPDAALLLRYGEERAGTLSEEHYHSYYTFGAKRGDVVTISMVRTGGTLDPYLILFNSRQEVLQEDDDSGEGNNALLQSYIVPETGTYYILATRYQREAGQTAGDYVVRLDGVSGEAPVVAPGMLTILYGSTVAGRIDDATPSTTYAFLGRAGDVVTISMTDTADDLDPLLLLFASDGTQLATDDDSGPGKDALISGFTIPQDGTYYIIATRYQFQEGRTSGQYSLSLVLQQPEPTPATTP